MTTPEGSEGQSVATSVVMTRRTWGGIRGRLPFAPYGLVPLIGLVALLFVALVPFAFGEIQAATDVSAREALKRAGADWATAEVSGQWVVLEGKPPSREAGEQALNAVRQAKAPTLFGEAEAATWVYDRFTWAEDPLMPASGDRPRIGSGDERAAPAPASPTDAQAANCDETMSALLNGSTIQFSTASIIVGTRSNTTLDAIARAAASCAGALRIEGHTDNVGRAGFNTILSRRRAEAVREALIARGVPAERLVAEGFGSQSPVATNDTSDGRARNRRIEIRTVRASPT